MTIPSTSDNVVSRYRRYVFVLPALIAAVVVIAADMVVERVALARFNDEARISTANTLGTLRARLEGEINSNAQLVRGLVALIAVEPDISQARFAALAEQLFRSKSQLRNIGAAPDLVIRYMYPLAGNEAAIGLDYSKNTLQRAAALRAKEVRDIVLAGPVNLVQGGQGFISRVPVFVADGSGGEGRFWGLISAVIDVNRLYIDSGLLDDDLPMQVAIRGRDARGANGELFFGAPEVFDANPVLMDVSLPHGSWQMAAIPIGGWPREVDNVVVIRSMFALSGLVIVGFFAVAGRLAQRRIEAEDNARQLDLRFRDFAESSSDWFWEMDDQLRFTYLSERFESVTGRPASAVLGKTRRELISPDALQTEAHKWDEHLNDLEEHRPFRNFEYEILPNYGGDAVTISVSGVPVFDEAGTFKGYRGSGEDVTERIRTQNDLRAAKDEADRANQAKSAFLSSMSHELRTPLNSILGFAQVLEIDPYMNENERHKLALWQIRKGGEHLLDLINDVLNLAQIESGRLSLSFEAINTKDIIDECISVAKTLRHTDGVSIEFQGFVGAVVNADRVRLKQVLLNLLSNAIKYNHKGGKVILASADVGRYQRISIADTGPGIAPDMHDELFKPFTRLGKESSNIEGTGIGLTITKTLIDAMGARIGFVSAPGEGTTFWVDLPLADAAQHVVTANAAGCELDSQVHKIVGRVLYVEDNPDNIQLMETILSQVDGLQVEAAYTAEQGIAAAQSNPPNLILMDINLPGMNGLEALAELRACDKTRDIPVIAISASVMAHDVQRGLDAGFAAYLPKPLDISQVMQAVADTIARV